MTEMKETEAIPQEMQCGHSPPCETWFMLKWRCPNCQEMNLTVEASDGLGLCTTCNEEVRLILTEKQV